MDIRQCDCCGRTREVGVASSQLGGVSFAYCKECLNNNAEPASMVNSTIETVDNVAPFVRSIRVYRDGIYYLFDDYRDKYYGNI